MIFVLFGLGSNTDYRGKKPAELLASACGELSKLLFSPMFSSIYESKAMYVENQNNFLNMAVKGFVPNETNPFDLLNKIHEIEAKFGRDRTKEIRFGPRPIDIDIEEFGNVVMNENPDLILPHPRLQEREFVLIPALEILTDSADEKIKNSFEKFLSALPNQDVKKSSEEIQTLFNSVLQNAKNGG